MNAIPNEVFLVLILALLALAVGLAIWIVDYFRGGGKKEEPSRERRSVLAGSTETETPEIAGEREVLRVSRTDKGELAIFILGQQYRHLREIRDREVGGEAVASIKAIMTFAEGWLPALRQASGRPPSPSAPTMVDEEVFLAQLRRADLFPAEKQSSGLFSRRSKEHKSSEPPKPLLTPADEINELVQQRLETRPHLSRHNIHLTTAEDGSLCIHVGLNVFDTPDKITDPEVRAFMEDTIREWGEQ